MTPEGITYRDDYGKLIKPISCRAIPGDTVFATQEGLIQTYPLHSLFGFERLDEKNKQPYLNNVVNDLIGNSERLITFYKTIRKFQVDNPEFTDRCEQFISSLSETYPKIATKQTKKINFNEEHINSLFELYIQDVDLKTPTPDYEKKAQTDLKTTSEIILRGLVEGSKTKEEIVYLINNLAISALSKKTLRADTEFYNIITYRSPILKPGDDQTKKYISCSVSSDEDLLAKYILLDYTGSLLEMMIDKDNKYYSKVINEMLEKYPDYQSELTNALKELKENYPGRLEQLTEFYEDRQIIENTLDDGENQVDDYLIPESEIPFPQNIMVRPNGLRRLYASRFSEFFLNNGKIKYPLITLTLPQDDSIRDVFSMKNDTELMTSEFLFAALTQTKGKKIENPFVIKDVLTYIRPLKLEEEKKKSLESLNQKKKTDLRNVPFLYGFHPRGDKIITDDSISAIKSIIFQPGKRAFAKISLLIGNYTVPLALDVNFNLKAEDGANLKIDHETLIWWETIILSYLKNFLCEPHSVETESTEGMSLEDKNNWVKRYFGRRQHRRELPFGHHFTIEQSQRYEKEYGLTLEELNKALNRVDSHDQVFTWVFPKEVDVPEDIPPVICKAPDAENDVKDALGRV